VNWSADTESSSSAAVKAHRSQFAVSVQLKKLQAAMGTRLLVQGPQLSTDFRKASRSLDMRAVWCSNAMRHIAPSGKSHAGAGAEPQSL